MARFPNEETAIAYFESIRWANGVVCPHCGNKDESKMWKIEAKAAKKIRVGLRQCAECKKQFRATIGTIFEDSHIPLNLRIVAWYLMAGAKKGISALQLKRTLWGDKGSYKTAWFMCHRIRHALKDPIFSEPMKGTVEVDETYVGGRTVGKGAAYKGNKTAVVALVERGGSVRSMTMDRVTGENLKAAVKENVMLCSNVYTDEHFGYVGLAPKFGHKSVKHSAKEYARKEGDENIHTNTVEGYFSLLKRGVIGAFHHVSKKHLPLYLAEFDHRYNHRTVSDGERMVAGMKKASGKRLSYKPLTRKPVAPLTSEQK